MNTRIFRINDDIFTYQVVFSKRRSIGITISPDKGIRVRAPFRTSQETIDDIIRSRVGWLKKHQTRFSEMKQTQEPLSYNDGSTHSFLGVSYRLNVVKSDSNYLRLTASGFEAGLKEGNNDEVVKKMFYRWYRAESQKYFAEALNDILYRIPALNIKQISLVVRTMKRRWGSCSVRGKITLNTELIRLDRKCIEYVIIHELCHLRHHNHSKDFYSLLGMMFPEWKEYRKKLKEHYL